MRNRLVTSLRISRRTLSAVVMVLAVAATTLAAQQLSGPDHYALLGQARTAMDQRRYPEAAGLYRRLADNNPRDGELWMAYASAARAAGRLADALQADEKVIELGAGFRPNASIKPMNLDLADRPQLAYRMARGYATLGRKDRALDWLTKAVAWRYTPRTSMQTDSAFRAYQDDDRFRELAGLPPKGIRSRDQRWRYDIDFLASECKRLHASFTREAYSPQFDAAATDLKARVGQLTDNQIIVGLQRLVVLLRDGHSIVAPADSGKLLPVDFYWFSDGLFVVNGIGDAKRWTGSRVLKFGSQNVEALLAQLPAYVSRDNPMGVRWIGPVMLTRLDFLQAMGGTSDPSRATLTLRGPTGAVTDVALEGGPNRPRPKLVPPYGDTVRAPLYLKRVTTNYWFTPLPEVNAVYFQFNQVINQPGGELLAQFAPKLLEAVKDPSVKNLIIDARHNNGGNSYLYPPLLRIFAYFQESSPGRQLFYVVGRNTFSAAQNFSTNVERLTNAIFVGEPTGSSPRFTGEGAIWFELPYSRVRASISNWYHQFTFWSDSRPWISPAVPVELSSTDYFAGRDPALEAVFDLIRHP
ncbi:MAG: tetratricopeptide repeat protein [Gemmatimonadota bacterium]